MKFIVGDDAANGLSPWDFPPENTGDDTIIGSSAAESLFGGNGNDVLDGNQGADTISGGNGEDLLIWDPGDGSDKLDGGNGFDTHLFNMGGQDELISLIEQDGHAILTRSVGSIVMDLDNIERVSFAGDGGGSDTFFIGELSASDVRAVDVDLGATPDHAVDTVSALGAAAHDRVTITTTDDGVSVRGLSVDVSVTHAEATDRLVVNALDGDDRIDVRGFTGGIDLTLWGGNGADRFLFGPSTGASVRILDFQGGDLIRLDAFPDHDFATAVASGHIAQAGADVVVSDGDGAIVTLKNVALADLGADDFLFH